MPSEEDIVAQRKLLAINRRTLRFLLEQRDRMGYANTATSVLHSIQEARENISRNKSTLRSWGMEIEDLPEDSDSENLSNRSNTTSYNEEPIQEIKGIDEEKERTESIIAEISTNSIIQAILKADIYYKFGLYDPVRVVINSSVVGFLSSLIAFLITLLQSAVRLDSALVFFAGFSSAMALISLYIFTRRAIISESNGNIFDVSAATIRIQGEESEELNKITIYRDVLPQEIRFSEIRSIAILGNDGYNLLVEVIRRDRNRILGYIESNTILISRYNFWDYISGHPNPHYLSESVLIEFRW